MVQGGAGWCSSLQYFFQGVDSITQRVCHIVLPFQFLSMDSITRSRGGQNSGKIGDITFDSDHFKVNLRADHLKQLPCIFSSVFISYARSMM